MKYKEENVFKRTNERMNKRDKHMIKSMRIHTHRQEQEIILKELLKMKRLI
jgi:hypothetical protein